MRGLVKSAVILTSTQWWINHGLKSIFHHNLSPKMRQACVDLYCECCVPADKSFPEVIVGSLQRTSAELADQLVGIS